MERQVIQVEILHDQAGITAALRQAFVQRQVPAQCAEEDDINHFAALLRKIH